MTGLFQGTSIIRYSKTGEYQSITVSYVHSPQDNCNNREDMIRVFRLCLVLENPLGRRSSNPYQILQESVQWAHDQKWDAVSSPCRTLATNRKLGIYLSISTGFLWIMWKSISRSSREFLRQINTWFRTWHLQRRNWGALYHILFFRRYWNWCL